MYTGASRHGQTILRCLGAAGASISAAVGLTQVVDYPNTVELEAHKSAKPLEESDLELRFVQVVFRHGARAPLTEKYGAHSHKWDYCHRAYEPVPIDIKGLEGTKRPQSQSDERQKKVVFKGGCKKGQLTHMGQVQALQLGTWLRQRYHTQQAFLPESYNADVLKVRSTNISRTLDTVTGVLSGLYPDTQEPILVETCEDSKEWLYPNHRHCKRLEQLIAGKRRRMRESGKTDYVSELESKLREALEISDKEEDISFTALYDVSHSVKFHSNQHHQSMSDGLLKELELKAVEAMKGFVAPEDNQEMVSLSIGKVLKDILQNMDQAASGKTVNAKMQLFSGHDTTLMPILVALGHELVRWPPFMSNLIFELYWSRSLQKHFVRIVYNKQVLRLKGDNGEGFVELSTFNQQLQKFISTDYNSACSAQGRDSKNASSVNVSGV